jgi:hypothetical protein
MIAIGTLFVIVADHIKVQVFSNFLEKDFQKSENFVNIFNYLDIMKLKEYYCDAVW